MLVGVSQEHGDRRNYPLRADGITFFGVSTQTERESQEFLFVVVFFRRCSPAQQTMKPSRVKVVPKNFYITSDHATLERFFPKKLKFTKLPVGGPVV